MQQVIAAHIEQGHLAYHGAEQLRTSHHAGRHQQAAVAAALDAKLRGAGHAATDERFAYRDEIVKGPLAMLALRRRVPTRAELPAAANMRDHIHAAAFEPA